MEEDIERTAEELRQKYELHKQRESKFRLRIPPRLRFALAWTLFFIIIGITIQSIQAGHFIFTEFFGANYVSWFKSFGSFVNPVAYQSVQEVVFSIFGGWYYFLYSGGLISLIWAIIDSLVNYEVYFK